MFVVIGWSIIVESNRTCLCYSTFLSESGPCTSIKVHRLPYISALLRLLYDHGYIERGKPEAVYMLYSYFEWLQWFFIVPQYQRALNSLDHCICPSRYEGAMGPAYRCGEEWQLYVVSWYDIRPTTICSSWSHRVWSAPHYLHQSGTRCMPDQDDDWQA